tara:strand:- start:51 stop:440 length:390 start_codon:yes stop_codon:yes gene_type:complete
MRSFGLSCDDETFRLIQSIPSGIRSKTIRNIILTYAFEIEEIKEEYWKIELEKKIEEKEHAERLAIEKEKLRELRDAELERERKESFRKLEREQMIFFLKQKQIQERAEWEASKWRTNCEHGELLIETN